MGNSKEGTVWQVPLGKLVAAATKLNQRLGSRGKEIFEFLDENESFCNHTADFLLSDMAITDKSLTSLNPSWVRAREIMGRNMFGVEEAIRHFGVNPSRQQIAGLSEIPFSEATLEQCKETHVLVAVFPLSILEIRGKVAQGQRLFYDQDWYNKQAFAKEKGETEWKLVRKTPVDSSTSKTWPEQQALLATNEETPTARTMVYTIIGHFLATGERLFEKIYVRCSDVGSGGGRVYVGYFDSGGLSVYGDGWGDSRVGSVGLSSARKSE